MGDASQAGNLNKSRFRSQLIIEGQQSNSPETDEYAPPERFPVLYTHSENDTALALVPNGQVICRSLEELLTHLECDVVESLWFDETVSPQERNYITGWARIFRPAVSSHKLQEKIAN